jgi:hypothetical protein
MDPLTISRSEKREIEIEVDAELTTAGTAVAVTGVDVAVTKPWTRPDGATVWTPVPGVAAGVGRLFVAGPDADPDGALLVLPDSADLWLLPHIAEPLEVAPVRARRINVL